MKKNEEVKSDNKVKNFFMKFLKELIPYVVILIVVVIIRTYFVTPIMVSGPSMQPTLKGGEVMILNKLGSIDRLDIVVVDIESEEIIKRVIAMPGETISCENGILYVNGKKFEEEFSQGRTYDFKKVTLKDDEYFVMGDNREDSLDSRKLGAFKKEQIEGTASLVLFPFDSLGFVD